MQESAEKKSSGDYVIRGINATLGGYLAGLFRLFRMKPEDWRKPTDRPNAPPPTGGISSLG